jgi:hypothetical protein
MKTVGAFFVRVLALTMILFICFSLAGRVLGPYAGSLTPEEVGGAAAALLAVCFLITIVLTHLVVRSRWAGWQLIATVFLVFYGVMSFMPQIESVVFLTSLPSGMLPRLFLMGVFTAAPFAVLAVLILGKRKAVAEDVASNARLIMPTNEWAWKLALIAIAYVVLYFSFGYYVAWKNSAVREYYGGSDPGSFLAQMSTVLRNTPWLIPFQMLRAVLWVAIALPVIRMLKGRWQETALALGLLFAVTNAQLLLPNPYMPEAVRMTHLIETASSNFIFGFLIGWLLTPRHELGSNRRVMVSSTLVAR